MKFLFLIVISILVAIFALQNSNVVTINFFNKSFEGSLALIVIICYLLGVLSGFFYIIPSIIRKNLTISELRDKLNSEKKDSTKNIPKS